MPIFSQLITATKISNAEELINIAVGDVETIQQAIQLNTYDKQEVDELLLDKANIATTYTKTDIDNMVGDINDELELKMEKIYVYTKTETDNLLTGKANQNTTYTKTETDNLLNAKAPQSTTYTKTETDNLLNNKVNTTLIGQANGICPLDAGNKVDINYLPTNIMQYKGTWNANTNTPTLANGSGDIGDIYIVSTAGTFNSVSYAVSDWIIYNGSVWQKSDANDDVVSVFGRIGVITAQESDYSSFFYTKSQSDGKYALQSTLSNYQLTSGMSNYALNSSLSNYALNSSLSNYQLVSGMSSYPLTSTLSDGTRNLISKTSNVISSTNEFNGTVFNGMAIKNNANASGTTARLMFVANTIANDYTTCTGAVDYRVVTSTAGRMILSVGYPNLTTMASVMELTNNNGSTSVLINGTIANTAGQTPSFSSQLVAKSYVDNNFQLSSAMTSYYNKTETDNLLGAKANQITTYTKTETYNKTETDNLLSGKANQLTTYTKVETDDLLNTKANQLTTYNKTETDNLLNAKANQSTTYTKTETYNKTETDNLLNAKANQLTTYTKTETDTLLNGKANQNTTYTKTEADNLLSEKANQNTTYTKVETDNFLSAKANQTSTYTKTETDILLNTKANTSLIGQANGICPLDAGNKVDINYLPTNIMQYKGTWNANTNTPTLANGSGDIGDIYIVSTAGTFNSVSYAVSDWIIYNGSVWQKSDANDDVVSVFGRIGVITAQESDYSSFFYTKSQSDEKYALQATLSDYQLTSGMSSYLLGSTASTTYASISNLQNTTVPVYNIGCQSITCRNTASGAVTTPLFLRNNTGSASGGVAMQFNLNIGSANSDDNTMVIQAQTVSASQSTFSFLTGYTGTNTRVANLVLTNTNGTASNTFIGSVSTSTAPSSGNNLCNKTYVDGQITSSLSSYPTITSIETATRNIKGISLEAQGTVAGDVYNGLTVANTRWDGGSRAMMTLSCSTGASNFTNRTEIEHRIITGTASRMNIRVGSANTAQTQILQLENNGGVMTTLFSGSVSTSTAPSSGNNLCNKTYVDGLVSGYLSTSSASSTYASITNLQNTSTPVYSIGCTNLTSTGNITASTAPVVGNHLCNKTYVDAQDGACLTWVQTWYYNKEYIDGLAFAQTLKLSVKSTDLAMSATSSSVNANYYEYNLTYTNDASKKFGNMIIPHNKYFYRQNIGKGYDWTHMHYIAYEVLTSSNISPQEGLISKLIGGSIPSQYHLIANSNFYLNGHSTDENYSTSTYFKDSVMYYSNVTGALQTQSITPTYTYPASARVVIVAGYYDYWTGSAYALREVLFYINATNNTLICKWENTFMNTGSYATYVNTYKMFYPAVIVNSNLSITKLRFYHNVPSAILSLCDTTSPSDSTIIYQFTQGTNILA